MHITLNNRPEIIDKNILTVKELLQLKNFTFKMMIIKINGKLIKKNAYAETIINNGDIVEILHMISGG